MNPMSYSNELIEKSVSFFRNILNAEFFNKSESFIKTTANYSTPVAAIVGLLMGLTAAIKTDSFIAFLLGILWVAVLAISYFIGSRFLNSCKTLITNNPTKFSSREYLDVTGLIYILIFIAIILGCLFFAIKLSSFDILKWGVLIAIPFLFYISLFLNPSQISTTIESGATAGEDALAIFILNSKATVKLAGIIFGTLTTIGALLLFFGWIDMLKSDGYALMMSGIQSLTGAYIVIAGLVYPYVIYLLFVFVYLFVDICKSILSIPENKMGSATPSAPRIHEEPTSYSNDNQANSSMATPQINIDPSTAKKVGKILAILAAIGALGYGGYLLKVEYDKKAAITRQQEEAKQKVEQAKKELVAQAQVALGRSANEFIHTPNAKLVFESIMGSEYATFEGAYALSDPLLLDNNQVLGYGCGFNQCGKLESAFVIDPATGSVSVGVATLGVAKYYGLPEGKPLPAAFEKWKQLRNVIDAPK